MELGWDVILGRNLSSSEFQLDSNLNNGVSSLVDEKIFGITKDGWVSSSEASNFAATTRSTLSLEGCQFSFLEGMAQPTFCCFTWLRCFVD